MSAVSLTPSHLIEHQYCPRYTYYEYVLRLPQFEEKYGKVLRGRDLHKRRLQQNRGYLRKRLGVVARHEDCYLAMPGLRGILDEVLELEDGTFAPLDYKFAKWKGRVQQTYRLQLTCYALLVRRTFSVPVNRGYLVYTRSKNHVKRVDITAADEDLVAGLINEITEVITTGRYPRKTKFASQCLSCTYRNICVT
jgi:CRISPR-associated exonuclease Cas4